MYHRYLEIAENNVKTSMEALHFLLFQMANYHNWFSIKVEDNNNNNDKNNNKCRIS